MTRNEHQLLWAVTAAVAALVIVYEYFFLPAGLPKIIVCAAALGVIGFALFKRRRRRRRT